MIGTLYSIVLCIKLMCQHVKCGLFVGLRAIVMASLFTFEQFLYDFNRMDSVNYS